MGCYPCGVRSYELFVNITQKSVILFIHGGLSSDLRRNLSTEHTEGTDFLSTEGTEDTDFFWGVASQEILEEIFIEMLLRKK